MTAIGIIPARYASTRFPGKVLAPLAGQPMVHHVYKAALRCRKLSAVLIATESPKVAAELARLGDRVVLTAADHASGSDRVAEAARPLEADLVLNIQGDEPQLDPAIIDGLVEFMESHPEYPLGTVGSTQIPAGGRENPGLVKVLADGHRALAFYRHLPAELPAGDLLRHIGLYAFRRSFLEEFTARGPSKAEKEHRLEQLRALDMGAAIGILTTHYEGIAIDYPADLQRLAKVWQLASQTGSA